MADRAPGVSEARERVEACWPMCDDWPAFRAALDAFEAAVREECAGLADAAADGWESHPGGPLFHAKVKAAMARYVAACIRASGVPPQEPRP